MRLMQTNERRGKKKIRQTRLPVVCTYVTSWVPFYRWTSVYLFAKSLCRCPCTRVMGEKDYELTYKILILGDSGVGKTCLIFRFIEDIFSDSYISTIGEPWLNFVLYMLFIKTSNISLTQQTLKSTRKCLNTVSYCAKMPT